MSPALAALTLLGYGFSTAWLLRLLWRSTAAISVWPALLPALLAWLAHVTMLLLAGLDLGFFHALSLVACWLVLLLLLSSLWQEVTCLALLLLPVVMVCVLLQQLFGTSGLPFPSSIRLHAVMSLLAFGLLALASFQAALLAWQNRLLHRHQDSCLLNGMAPLQWQERQMFWSVGLGFLLLSISLLSGFFQLRDLLAQHLAHKMFFALLAWVTLAILLLGRWRFGWRGRQAAAMALWAGLFLLLAYFGSKFVLELLLR